MAFTPEQMVVRKRGWTAQIIRNDDDDGWAIAMTRDGDDEPVYTAPWTMGRNKKDPKPLNDKDFLVWIKSAREFLERSRFQSRTRNRRSVDVTSADGQDLTVVFDVRGGDCEATGVLTALDAIGQQLGRSECDPSFELTLESAEDWVNSGFEAPVVEERFVEEEVVYEDGYQDEYEETYIDYDEE